MFDPGRPIAHSKAWTVGVPSVLLLRILGILGTTDAANRAGVRPGGCARACVELHHDSSIARRTSSEDRFFRCTTAEKIERITPTNRFENSSVTMMMNDTKYLGAGRGFSREEMMGLREL